MSLSLRPLAVAAIVVASAVGISAAAPAVAAELKPVTKAPPAPPAWWDTFEISGHVEGGITGNSVTPVDGLNFGHLFTDRANTFLLNQALLTIQRPVDPKATGFDAGFKFQAMYGTDARYPHFLGEFDQSISSRNQVDIVEAHALFHLPWLTSGGIDVKVGQYVTLEGAEAIPASDNLLYTHSYIFNFGIPAKHTGIMTTTHVTSLFELHLGIDTGVNTTFNNSFNCFNCGDNNHAAAFHGGLGFNLLDGKLTILATTHIGPENPNVSAVVAAGVNPNQDLRYLNDVTITFKPTDRLTFMTDLNYIRDDGFGATGGGVAQYVAYAINDWLKIVGRGEVWRDDNSFFVAAFPGNLDFVMAEHGNPNAVVIPGGATTYGALTAGLNITPEIPKGGAIKAIIYRPEIRYDSSLNGTTPFAAGTKSSQFTFGGDVIVRF
jgi:hypothetical protein